LAALPYISAFDTNAADAEQDRAIGDWEHVAEPLLIELHENLLAEVISAAGSIERLVLLPHGPMHALPLHAALRYGGQEKRYLLDDIEVSYIPSFALLRPAAGGAKRPESLLGVCNPSGDLPQSEKEVLEIAAFFSHPLVLSGARATIANVNQAADQIDVLHFACHGDLDLATPYSSCLYLAPETSTPNSDNGSSESRTRAATRLLKIVDGAATLTANSPRAPAAAEAWTLGGILRDLRIPNARLVVLSACKSGLFSESRLPDEYLGLAAGFLAAGAQTVISSLWAVPDQTTRLLMTRFYAHWLGAGLPPASALRAAQTDVRSLPGCNNPYYWAAFHVSGP